MEKRLLLTGATGLVGGNLIARLLRSDSTMRIVALVRGKSQRDAEMRLRKVLKEVSPAPCPIGSNERLSVIQGDITSAHLGLEDASYNELAHSVTHVIHSAANVEFQLPLQTARHINCEGTRNVIALARQAKEAGSLQRFAYIGTAYVAGNRPGRVYEDELECGQRFSNTYEQSKYESECHMRELMSELPITVFRPSIIVGDSQSGKTSTFNVLYFPLRMIYRGLLRIIPGSRNTPTDVVPVDYVCEALVHIFLQAQDCSGRTYHLTAGEENATTVGEVVDLSVDYFNRHGNKSQIQPVRFVPLQLYHFAKRVMTGNVRRAGQLVSIYESYLNVHRQFNDSHTKAALTGSGIVPPSFRKYYQAILRFCVESNWGHQYRFVR